MSRSNPIKGMMETHGFLRDMISLEDASDASRFFGNGRERRVVPIILCIEATGHINLFRTVITEFESFTYWLSVGNDVRMNKLVSRLVPGLSVIHTLSPPPRFGIR